MSQAWRMLLRDWRAGELRVLAMALAIAVAAITSVAFFADRIAQGLARDAHQLLGADLAYMGTRFIATQESQASDEYKRMLLEARAQDIVHTAAVSGVPASFMRQSLALAGYQEHDLNSTGEMNHGAKIKPVSDEAKAWKTVWSAGQGVGQIGDLPRTDELIARLDREYRAAFGQTAKISKRWAV